MTDVDVPFDTSGSMSLLQVSTHSQVNWVLDTDIRGFFDAMAHSWIIRFLDHCITDKRILRLIAKWLKGRHCRRWTQNTWRMWRSARRGDLTDSGERLPALCVRPMGPSLALYQGVWRHDRHPLCGRHHRRPTAFALLLMLAASAVAVIHLPANPNAAACVSKLWFPFF
jgi:hypothetical protein